MSQWPARFGVRLHAYVLMVNHYHLVVETPEDNLSRAVQWVNVRYSVWFNWRHRRSGHLLQGRFKAILLAEDVGLQRVARYVHLNPVRVLRLGLGKERQQAVRHGLAGAPRGEIMAQRLDVLRQYRWSSYGPLAGYRATPDWLWHKRLRGLCGGRSHREQMRAVRKYTEEAVREGLSENAWEGLVGGIILGSADYAQQLLKRVKRNRREEPAEARTAGRVSWERIVKSVERVKKERWEAFKSRHGDWGRDAALWLGRHAGRMPLGELAALVERCDYTTVAKAVSRFGKRLAQDRKLAAQFQAIQNELSKI